MRTRYRPMFSSVSGSTNIGLLNDGSLAALSVVELSDNDASSSEGDDTATPADDDDDDGAGAADCSRSRSPATRNTAECRFRSGSLLAASLVLVLVVVLVVVVVVASVAVELDSAPQWCDGGGSEIEGGGSVDCCDAALSVGDGAFCTVASSESSGRAGSCVSTISRCTLGA